MTYSRLDRRKLKRQKLERGVTFSAGTNINIAENFEVR
jgi:hypothetical protein